MDKPPFNRPIVANRWHWPSAEEMYSVVNAYTPQCADYYDEHVRMVHRTRYTTLKTNEPEFNACAEPGEYERATSTNRVSSGPKSALQPHACEDCAPLAPDDPLFGKKSPGWENRAVAKVTKSVPTPKKRGRPRKQTAKEQIANEPRGFTEREWLQIVRANEQSLAAIYKETLATEKK